MLTASDLPRLLQQGEGPTLEFKANTPFPHHLARLISGFANAAGGTVLVGVREPNTVIGTDPAKFENFVKRALERLHGDTEVTHYVLEVDDKAVGVIEVANASTPVASSDGYFIRVGEQEHALSAQQLVERMGAVPDDTQAITSLSETISAQTAEIGKLRESFDKANSWQRKLFYALVGAGATAIVKLVLAAVGLSDG